MDFRRYETLILISPDLGPEETEQVRQKFTDIIGNMSGRIIRMEDWGRRRLAYPVEKQMYGQYTLLDYMGTPPLLAELERNLGIEERVFKFLTLVLDKRFSPEKCEQTIERLQAEQQKREAERAQREAERAQREAEEESGEADRRRGGYSSRDDDDADDDSDED